MTELPRLGSRLRKFRCRSKLSQPQLAQVSGVSRSVIAEIEAGKRSGITLRNALHLASALGVSVEVLAGWDPLDHQVSK